MWRRRRKLRELRNDQRGITAVEYALLISLIGVVVALAVSFLALAVQDTFQETEDNLTNSPSTGD